MTDTKPHFATVVLALGIPPVEHDVCLNLTALCEVEDVLKVNCFDLLPTGGRPLAFGIREAIVIINAGLRGAGKRVDRASVEKLLTPMTPQDIVGCAAKALMAAFVPDQATETPN